MPSNYILTKEIEGITYKINKGSLKAINEFKAFVGDAVYDDIVNSGAEFIDIPLDTEGYNKLKEIVLVEAPEEVPFHHMQEVLGFFCEPFAGQSLKRMKSTLDGISSALGKLDQQQLKTMMQSITSQTRNGKNTDAIN